MNARFLLLLIAFALPAAGQNAKPGDTPPADFKPLAERKDVLSWKLLSQVELIKQKDRYVPQFAAGISALDKKDVKVQGFMMPLSVGEQQSHFVVSAMPQSCAFCLPGGPESLVEVKTKKPVKYTFEPMVLSGKLSVLKEDPTGIFYRLTDAELTK
jgi:uncharacterized protein